MKVAIVGMGNMGTALYESFGDDLIAIKRGDDFEVVKDASQIWLCVKPLQLTEVLQELKKFIREDQLVVSIVAGKKIASIKKELGTNHPVVRVMPNTPLLVGYGMSGWVCSCEVTATQKSAVKKLLMAVGEEIEFRDEDWIDKVTAISGSGPAYFFATIEALLVGANSLGFSDDEATQLVRQTFMGAAQLLKQTGKSAKELREMVTSKGGTTEAALKVLKDKRFEEIWLVAVRAAHKRCYDLGKETK